MKLFQLNIWEGKILKEVLAFIEKEQPDILCLQEVFSCTGDITVPDLMFNSLELLQAQTGFTHSFFSPVFTSMFAGVPASFGSAIISRYPLRSRESIFTNGAYNPNQTAANYVPNVRTLQICKVSIGEKVLSLANHHGHREADPLGNKTSVDKMQLVKSKLELLEGPLIFSGDLNVKAESPAMRVFDGFLKDLTAAYGITSTLTELGKAKNVACDHVLVSDDVSVRSFRAAEELVSDHKALVLDFEL